MSKEMPKKPSLSVSEIMQKRSELRNMLDSYKRPVAIMFTDIKGSTSYFEQFGDVAGREMIETHNVMMFPIIEVHEGHVIQTIGDAIMAYFESAELAVRAAIAMQLALDEHNQKNTDEINQIHIRIGIHFGEGLLEFAEDGEVADIYGDVVNTAARVETALNKQTDQILVSRAVYDEVRESRDIQCESCEAVEAKNKAELLEIFRVLWHPKDRMGSVIGRSEDRLIVGNRYAVVVGCNVYKDHAIPDLNYAVSDAAAFSRVLASCGRFPKDHITLLTDQEATLKNIRTALSSIRAAAPEDLVLLYFAGHGCPDAYTSSKGPDEWTWRYLVPHDAERDNLYATALPMDEMKQLFSHIKSQRVVVFLDSCYSGGGGRSFADTSARGMFSNALLEEIAGEGRVVITASDINELAYEKEDLGHGLFTHYLVRGLQGEADSRNAGFITIPQLFEYLADKIPREAAKLGGRQHPILRGQPEPGLPLAFSASSDQETSVDLDRKYDEIFSQGQQAISDEDWDTAEAAFSKALELRPGSKAVVDKMDLIAIAREQDEALQLAREEQEQQNEEESARRERVEAERRLEMQRQEEEEKLRQTQALEKQEEAKRRRARALKQREEEDQIWQKVSDRRENEEKEKRAKKVKKRKLAIKIGFRVIVSIAMGWIVGGIAGILWAGVSGDDPQVASVTASLGGVVGTMWGVARSEKEVAEYRALNVEADS